MSPSRRMYFNIVCLEIQLKEEKEGKNNGKIKHIKNN